MNISRLIKNIKQCGGEDNLRHFINALNDYVKDTNFTKFFMDKQSFYQKIIEVNLEENMTKQGYSDWECCVNEHIIQAIVARLVCHNIGKKSAEFILKIDKEGKHYLYEEYIYNILEKYENNRNQYKTFEDFYPEIISVFRENYRNL